MGQPSGGSNPEATVACAYERDDILTGKITTTFRGYPWNKTNAVETDQPRSSPNPDVTIRSLRNRCWSSGKNAVLRSPRRMCILGDAPARIDCPSRRPQAAEHQRTKRDGSKIKQLACLSKSRLLTRESRFTHRTTLQFSWPVPTHSPLQGTACIFLQVHQIGNKPRRTAIVT